MNRRTFLVLPIFLAPVDLFRGRKQKLVLVGGTLPPATHGVPYSQSIASEASGGRPPYSFSLLSATGPDSWQVSSSGTITGTPL